MAKVFVVLLIAGAGWFVLRDGLNELKRQQEETD